MAKALHLYGGAGATTTTDTFSGVVYTSGFLTPDISDLETDYQTIHRSAGTYSNFWGRIRSNAVTVTSTITFRKNAANSNESFTVAASTTGTFTDSTHTDSVVAADKFGVKVDRGTDSTHNIEVSVEAAIFDATTDTVVRITSSDNSTSTGSSTTYYPIHIGSDEGVTLV